MKIAGKDDIADWVRHLPNKLTFGRIAVIPVIIALFPIDVFAVRMFCAILFLAAALTDFLDGYLARKYSSETLTGALLDPIADKILVSTGLILIVSSGNLYAWIAAVLIAREISISGLRLIATEKNYTIKVSGLGKVKTGFQTAAIFGLMIGETVFDFPFKAAGMLCIWIALGLSLYSAYLYWRGFWNQFKNEL